MLSTVQISSTFDNGTPFATLSKDLGAQAPRPYLVQFMILAYSPLSFRSDLLKESWCNTNIYKSSYGILIRLLSSTVELLAQKWQLVNGWAGPFPPQGLYRFMTYLASPADYSLSTWCLSSQCMLKSLMFSTETHILCLFSYLKNKVEIQLESDSRKEATETSTRRTQQLPSYSCRSYRISRSCLGNDRVTVWEAEEFL